MSPHFVRSTSVRQLSSARLGPGIGGGYGAPYTTYGYGTVGGGTAYPGGG